MAGYTTKYLLYRRELMNELRDMDPDELIDVLGFDTDTLMGRLAIDIDNYIETQYDKSIDQEEEDLCDDDEY